MIEETIGSARLNKKSRPFEETLRDAQNLMSQKLMTYGQDYGKKLK